MPAKNVTKQYIEDGYYHIYNRGVEKRVIFQDQQDYSVFLGYLKEYLTPKDEAALRTKFEHRSTSPTEKDRLLKALKMNNFSGEITLLAYCLMPNHFHFLIKQKNAREINKFMNSLATRYAMYFNRKYKRVGSLYQDTYKAVFVSSNEQLLHLSRYIHKQALSVPSILGSGQPCSYPAFIGNQKIDWIHPEEILAFFSQASHNNSYKSFANQSDDSDEIELIYPLLLEE